MNNKHHHRIAQIPTLQRYGISLALQEAFETYLANSPSWELYRMNPCLLAERLQIELVTALHLLLSAVAARMMLLHWELRCATCNALLGLPVTALQLKAHYTCISCQNQFVTSLSDDISVSFSLNPVYSGLGQLENEEFRSQIDQQYGLVTARLMLKTPAFQRLFPEQHAKLLELEQITSLRHC
jgi:hypothetical protein